jgi:hypothetical protein
VLERKVDLIWPYKLSFVELIKVDGFPSTFVIFYDTMIRPLHSCFKRSHYVYPATKCRRRGTS